MSIRANPKENSRTTQHDSVNLAHGKHILSVKTQFLRRRALSDFDHLYCQAELFFRITASKGTENVIFESETCIQNAQHSKSLLDVRLVEKLGHLPPDR